MDIQRFCLFFYRILTVLKINSENFIPLKKHFFYKKKILLTIYEGQN